MSVTSRSIAACSTVVLLSLLSPGVAHAGEQADTAGATGGSSQSCGRGDRGRLLGFEPIASYPTPADARAYFESWVDFYRDFYGFAEDLTADVAYGFDAYKVTYCSIDAVLQGQDRAEPTVLTGNVSVPRRLDRCPRLPMCAVPARRTTTHRRIPTSPATWSRGAKASRDRLRVPSSRATASFTWRPI